MLLRLGLFTVIYMFVRIPLRLLTDIPHTWVEFIPRLSIHTYLLDAVQIKTLSPAESKLVIAASFRVDDL